MKIKHLIWLILLIPFLNSCNGDNVSAKNKQPNLGTPDSKLLVLSGNYLEMGTEYGEILHGKLTDSLRILKDFYITQHGATWNQMVLEADKLYARYPSEYKQFLYGMVVGSHLTLDEIKVLNGMETVGRIISQGQDLPQCAFLLIPKYRTTTGSSIIGRNYDYPAPFDKLSHNVVVTVLRPFNKLPVAIVGIAGEVYCPTCINSKGIFLELNNGTPSGGHDIVQTDTMLARMLQVAQTANNLQDAVKQLDQKSSDYSLIVNVADKQSGVSFEYATANNLGMKWYEFSLLDTSVVTNFFLNPNWNGLIPKPDDTSTWLGVTRRNNLLSLSRQSYVSVNDTLNIMSKDIDHGGAKWDLTIYQLVFDEQTMDLYLKINHDSDQWQKIPLKNVL